MAKVWRLVGGEGRRRSSAWHASAAALAAVAGHGSVATANAGDEPASGREIWAGADVSENVWLVYSGVTLAPWSGIHDDGWRFRAAGGYGAYKYDSTIWDTTLHDTRQQRFEARTYNADILVGYLKRFGPLTAKGFVGASMISHDIEPLDEQAVAFGDEVGVKGVVELWLNIGERAWGSLDLSWASAHETRAAHARLGYRVWPALSLGVEGAVNIDAQAECRVNGTHTSRCNLLSEEIDRAELLDYARGGVFARYEWGTGEVSLSAGVLGGSFGSGRHDDTDVAPYVTFNWLTQF
ncbi:cellulose biosynthesis protein BcsS [Hyphomicrobium sp.]|uniref:cellulose biosynthesis protein BcsS n=1 Tax=Hyphomicrobium sp. TaxID=82 RepID=UPI002FE0B9A2